MAVPLQVDGGGDASGVAAPAPGRAEPKAAWWEFGSGLAVLTACLLAGEGLKARLGLILPGSILGLFILLALLGTGVVRLRWVEAAARLLLWLLPFLFLPIFVLAMSDQKFWAVQGRALAGAVVVGTVLLWAAVGLGGQAMMRRRRGMTNDE